MAADPHRPRLIWHGAGRTELSTASLANWSAKTAGLLVDELGGRTGGTVVWRVRRSWQAVPLLLGSWWAGMVVTDLYDEAAESRAVAAFIDDDDESGADEVIVASSHPFGLADRRDLRVRPARRRRGAAAGGPVHPAATRRHR